MPGAVALCGSLCVAAARKGDVAMLTHMHPDPQCDGHAGAVAQAAAEGGQIAALEWLLSQPPARAPSSSPPSAGPPAPTSRWLQDPRICAVAALRGRRGALEWLRAHHARWDETTCEGAAAGGHLGLLRWLHAEGCPWDERTFRAAVTSYDMDESDRWEMLEWLRDQRCPWDASVFSAAAEHGRLRVLEWLHAGGCPWDERTFRAAVTSCDMDEPDRWKVLEWLRDQRCPWDASVFSAAAKHCRLRVLEWLHRHGCPWHPQTVCLYAARMGHLPVLQVVRRLLPNTVAADAGRGQPAHRRMSFFDATRGVCAEAACHDQRAVLRWAHGQGCAFDWGVGASAAWAGRKEILDWVYRDCHCPWHPHVWVYALCGRARADVVPWLNRYVRLWDLDLDYIVTWCSDEQIDLLLSWAIRGHIPWPANTSVRNLVNKNPTDDDNDGRDNDACSSHHYAHIADIFG
jgi:hypothetical protein